MARLVDITVDHLEKVHSYDRKTDFVPVDVLREREREQSITKTRSSSLLTYISLNSLIL